MQDKVYDLRSNDSFQNHYIDTKGSGGGGGDMGNGNYVTHKELELTKEAIEKSVKIVETKVDHANENISRIDKKINWIITLVVGSIIVPIVLELVKQITLKNLGS